MNNKTEKAPTTLLAVYGSLRKGQYNSERFSKSHLPKTFTIKGYKLYSLSSYPFAVETGNDEDELTVDLLDLSGKEETMESIRLMELLAGYQEKEIVVGGKPCIIYLYPKGSKNEHPVKSGDWVKYNSERIKERKAIT